MDHSQKVVRLLEQGIDQLDIILDNAGVELFTDLLLAFELLKLGVVGRVNLHAKAYPTFVSDATPQDVTELVDILLNHQDEAVRSTFSEVFNMINSIKITVRPHKYWNSHHHFYNMPPDLREDLHASGLIIFKGDLNYRRVFGDRKLPVNAGVKKLAGYLPSASMAIRILKSELMVGLQKEAADRLDLLDGNWKFNGKYGIIQLLK